jgi:hypothetical protein
MTIEKWAHPARIRKLRTKKKETGSGLEKVTAKVVKKMTTEKKLSPSAKNRAEKRVIKQQRYREAKEDESKVFTADKKLADSLRGSEKGFGKKKKAVVKHVPSCLLGDELPKDVPELEVIEAWGGAKALLLLSKGPHPRTSQKFRMHLPDTNSNTGVGTAHRDYGIATKGLTQPLKSGKSAMMHDFKKLESSVSKKLMPEINTELGKLLGKSQSSRRERRALARRIILSEREEDRSQMTTPVQGSIYWRPDADEVVALWSDLKSYFGATVRMKTAADKVEKLRLDTMKRTILQRVHETSTKWVMREERFVEEFWAHKADDYQWQFPHLISNKRPGV